MTARPESFECPWCGPSGLPVDLGLPPALRLCDACGEAQIAADLCPQPPPRHSRVVDRGVRPPVPDPALEEHRASLRGILRAALRDFSRRWDGAEHGKAMAGNAILGAMGGAGLDPVAEVAAALADQTPAERATLRLFVRLPEAAP